MQYVLGIDLGTSSTKTVLFDAQGKQVCEASQEYPLYQPQNGWAEQEPEDWFHAAVQTIRKVVEESGVPKEQIVGIGLSGQMHGLVMLDEAGSVLRRCIIWADQRTAAECEEITRRVGYERLIEETCNPALPGFTASKILWVQNHEPELYKRCRYILLPKDYLRYRLTGELATEVSDASGMQLLNVPQRKWSQVMLDALNLREDMLGKVYESPDITGRITESTARATGLAVGTPVVGGAGDNAAAAIGTGVVRDGRAFTTIGTSGVVFAHTDQIAIDPKGRVHTFCCAVPGAWHMMGVTQAAGLSLQWFRNNFYPEDKDYVQINADAADTPIGANRLVFLPYLMGERTPHLDADCRGGFVGLSAIHTKKDMARAVMEGVSYSLRDCLSVLNEMGVEPDNMVLSGGGAKSPLWQQMLTDAFHCNTCLSSKENSAALGAAILAAVGAGLYKSVPEAADAILQYNREATPDAAAAQKYSQVYRVYRMMYPGLKDAWKELAKLN